MDKTQTVEVGFKASPQAGSVTFRRCPSCGTGQHFNMFERTDLIQCRDCGHQWAR